MTEPTSSTPSRSNRRQSRRESPKRGTKALAYRTVLGVGPNIAAKVLDISESGVRLLLKQELPIGREFEVTLDGPGGRTVTVDARVMWSVPTADEQFCVGAQFDKMVAYIDLVALTLP